MENYFHKNQTLKGTNMRRIFNILLILALIIPLACGTLFAAGGNIEGYVTDAKTGEPLFGTNIILVGTSMGGVADIDGKYVLPNVPAGTYTMRVSYIGYKEQKIEIKVETGGQLKKNFRLEAVGIEGQTVVVTAQASGQKAAINQQLSSDQIVNVVSAAKIQELPDANAAESVGRLPGVSIQRSGGEGAAIVIRGLSPKYNEIMIDGVKMSSTNAVDRGTDLSMVSSNMLDGIQVSKTVTADMDADVIGGTVNFELKEAKVKTLGVPEFSIQIQGGYNNLPDAYNKMNSYKYVGSVEDRFLDDKLGVFAQIDIERKNLSSNELGATYTHPGQDFVNVLTTLINLNDLARDRQRYNGALVVDYKLPEGKIKITNFFSSGVTNAQTREESFDITNNENIYTLSNTNTILNIITNAIDLKQHISIFDLDAKISHAYSETKDPNDWALNFMQISAGVGDYIKIQNASPKVIINAANNDLSHTYLNILSTSSSFSRERALTGSLNLKTNFNFSDLVSAEIKFGGKFRYQTRSYNYDIYDGGGFQVGGSNYADNLVISRFSLPSDLGSKIPIAYFTDPNYNYGKFLNGDYPMHTPLNSGMILSLVSMMKANINQLAAVNGANAYGHDNLNSTTNNYSGNESLSAFYIMSNVNLGQYITVIPGIRYQNLETNYSGIRGVENRNSFDAYPHYDTTVVQNHGYWLPDLSVRYKPLSWFDLRLSYTNTLAYPDFSAIIPRTDVGNGTIYWNDYKLLPSRSANYDVYLSFYDNTIGLFTVGGFLKQIENLIYPWNFYISKTADILKYYPYSFLNPSSPPKGTYQVTTYVNDTYKIKDYGMELDWQTHFWYLPGPLSGLVFNVNYTHIFSKAEYPYQNNVSPNFHTVLYVDTSYKDRLLDQPDDIINLSLGFDYKDFSVRVSMLYQTDIFSGTNYWPQLRSHTSAYRRWDLSTKQTLPWFNIELYGDINNINGANDVSVIQGAGGLPTSEQDYGLTADLGLRVTL
jgi:TonB-dependent receptor